MLISRSDNSNIALWWWTIDRFLLTLFSILIIVGIFLVMASSQHLAQSFNIFSHYFTLRHILFVIISLPIIFLFSLSTSKISDSTLPKKLSPLKLFNVLV